MGLLLQRLSLAHFRNISHLTLTPSPETTILVGPNAVGKTNTVEALQLITAGVTFRHTTTQNLIEETHEKACIEAKFVGDGRKIDVGCTITPHNKQFFRNEKKCSAADISGTLLSVLFNPDDLAFVKNSASWRRDEIDMFASQLNRGYSRILSSYLRSIEQRNHLLKDPYLSPSVLGAWDDSVARGGAAVLYSRLRLFERIQQHVCEIYSTISQGEKLTCEYKASLGEGLEGATKDDLTNIFLAQLEEGRAEDIRRQQTCRGPHRDDISFKIEGRDARSFGSQGQQRSIILAWKMAEVRVAAEITDQQPLLLLDDVMSELDDVRRDMITNFIEQNIQTIITTTHLEYFSTELLDRAEVVYFGK